VNLPLFAGTTFGSFVFCPSAKNTTLPEIEVCDSRLPLKIRIPEWIAPHVANCKLDLAGEGDLVRIEPLPTRLGWPRPAAKHSRARILLIVPTNQFWFFDELSLTLTKMEK
jgi:hypothetical protein